MTQWHSGPPPSLGWWPCRFKDWPDSECLRWWDGSRWSCSALETSPRVEAAYMARHPTRYTNREIQWSDRPAEWPERSKT